MTSAVNCRPLNGCVLLRAESRPSSSGRRFYLLTSDPPALQQSHNAGRATEVAIAVRALNRMLELGRPGSVRVA
jgi:hypothetical protein